MALYLFAVHQDADRTPLTPERQEQAFRDTGAFNDRMSALGAFVFANGLEPPTTARVVDARGEQAVWTDGPYLGQAPRWFSGFWVIEAPDDQTAQAWAVEASRACNEPVEVRPFHR